VKNLNLRSKECCLCLLPYSDPFVLPCGHSFDMHCIKEMNITSCPLDNSPFDVTKLVENITLKGMMEDKIIPTDVYELFCIDISSSMWYSDNLIGLFGTSRLDIAKEFVKNITSKRLSETNSGHMIGISSFDSDFKFLIRTDNKAQCLHQLESLKPIGKYTALLDSVLECQIELQKYASNCQLRLIILTDGADNCSAERSKNNPNLKTLEEANQKGKKLGIYTAVYGIGGDTKQIKKMAEDLGAKFHHLQKENVEDHVTNFLNRMSSRNQQLECAMSIVTVPQEDPLTPQPQPQQQSQQVQSVTSGDTIGPEKQLETAA